VYHPQMQKLTLSLIVLLSLCGCSRHHQPLEASKKAKLVSELISNAPRCSTFKQQLASPEMDDDKIDDVYHAATKAQCTTRDS